ALDHLGLALDALVVLRQLGVPIVFFDGDDRAFRLLQHGVSLNRLNRGFLAMPQGPVTASFAQRAPGLSLFAMALALTMSAPHAPAQPARCAPPRIALNVPAGQAPGFGDSLAQDIRSAIEAVCGWWGATYDGPFHIVVDNFDGPA